MTEPRPPLTVGAPYRCPRCRHDHIVERPHAERETAERLHLYVECRGLRYFVGQIAAGSEAAENGR